MRRDVEAESLSAAALRVSLNAPFHANILDAAWEVVCTLDGFITESGGALTCTEIEALCHLANMIGEHGRAIAWRRGDHGDSDEEGDEHWRGDPGR